MMMKKKSKKPGIWKSLTEMREPGLKRAEVTSVFRAVNFELYATPNKAFVAIGVTAITACLSYLTYMNYKAKKAAGGKEIYNAVQTDGSYATMIRESKWD